MLSTIFVSTLLFLGIILIAKVLCVVLVQPKRKWKRPSSILIVHLSCVAICYAILVAVQFAHKRNVLSLTGPGVCELVSVLSRLLKGIFSLNFFAIVFERFQTFNCFNRGKLLLKRMLFLIWSISIIGALPSVIMTKSLEMPSAKNVTTRKCQSIPLFGSLTSTIIFEGFYIIVFHFIVVFYMIYALYKIKVSLTQLYMLKPVPDQNTQQKVRKIRFILVHFISFIVIWVPLGILLFVVKVFRRANLNSWSSIWGMEKLLGVIIYIYMVLNPLIYLWLMSRKRSPVEFSSRRSSFNPSITQNQQQVCNLQEPDIRTRPDLKVMPEQVPSELRRMSACVLSPANSIDLQATVEHYKMTSI